MKTAVVEVGGLVSVLSAEGVQKQLRKLSGVHHAEVNYVAQSATIHYDEQQVTLDDIRERIVECGYHCRGEMLPQHQCERDATAQAAPAAAAHEHHEHHHAAGAGAMPASTAAASTPIGHEHTAHAAAAHPPGHDHAAGAAHAEHEM